METFLPLMEDAGLMDQNHRVLYRHGKHIGMLCFMLWCFTSVTRVSHSAHLFSLFIHWGSQWGYQQWWQLTKHSLPKFKPKSEFISQSIFKEKGYYEKEGKEIFREPMTLCATMNTTGEYIQNILKLEETERETFICESYNLKTKGSQGWNTSFAMLECYNSVCALLY